MIHLLDINPYANWLFVNSSKCSVRTHTDVCFWRILIGLAMVDLWIIFNNFIAASISGPPVQLNLTEHIEPPNVKKKIFSNSKEIFVHFWFMNSEWGRYRGFLMTIQPNGKRNIQ